MAVNQCYPVKQGFGITPFVDSVAQKLAKEEFKVEALVMGPSGASILIKKNRGGFADFVGLGFECRITMVIYNGNLNFTIEHNRAKQINALWLGAVTCGALTVTGAIGLAVQNSITADIVAAISSLL